MSVHGILVIDKPRGLSSAAAVEHVKRALGVDRAGHGGTLDPLATGVLAICLNAGTKIAQYLQADDKAYEATGVLGIETDTLDQTGRVTAEREGVVTEAALRELRARRTGEQDQIPPMYSAIKQGGVRLYHRARNGEDVDRPARQIRIDRLELLAFEPPRFRIAIACSKGTYVRSILADLGTALGCGAHLAELRRTRSGRLSIAQAVPVDAVGGLDVSGLIPLAQATGLPSVVAAADLVGPIRSGLQLATEAFPPHEHQLFQIVDEQGRLVAIAHPGAGRVIYDRVFRADATS